MPACCFCDWEDRKSPEKTDGSCRIYEVEHPVRFGWNVAEGVVWVVLSGVTRECAQERVEGWPG